jgi:hypothetical protein
MLFATPEEHAANPPESWAVVKVTDRCWHLTTRDGDTLASLPTRRAGEARRVDGFEVNLYVKEGRWFAGERVDNWKPYEPK